MEYRYMPKMDGITKEARIKLNKKIKDRRLLLGQLMDIDDVRNGITSLEALDIYISVCMRHALEFDYLQSCRYRIESLKRAYVGCTDDEFYILMAQLGEIGGEIGGIHRSIRSDCILCLSVFLIRNQRTSKRSIIGMQRKTFGASLKNDVLNDVFANKENSPGKKIQKLVVDESEAKEAGKIYQKYSKRYCSSPKLKTN